MRPRYFLSLLSSLLFFLTPILHASEVKWPAKIGSFTLQQGTFKPDGTPSFLDPQLAGLGKESGFVNTTFKYYLSAKGGAKLILFTFKDSSGAYEARTFLQGIGGTLSDVVQRGNLVLWIDDKSGFSTEDMKSLAEWVAKVSDRVASPPVASHLPEKDREPMTDRYALGPIGFQYAARGANQPDAAALVDQAGFNSGAEAMFAKYKSGRDEATFLLIEYPTPQLAELHLKHMQRAILGMKNGTSVERKGSLLSIVFAPTSQEYAEKLRSAVNYETQVTWSEPSTTATDPPIMSTVVKIFIATGVFMVVTVVVGIAFGGVRIITKRLFPGRVFDRKDQIEVLQLGLSSKPIDPTDMY